MNSFLNISKQLPKAVISRKLNSQNGNDAEILSASNLISAFGAEIRWGSRNEDGSKIDLFISYEHPWKKGERIILLVQVKSGSSYGKVKDGIFTLYKRGFKEVKRSLNNICLIWLDQNSGNSYWAYIHPNSQSKATRYGKNHILTPCIRYEIARNISRNHSFINQGGRGITLELARTQAPIHDYRKEIKNTYSGFGKVESPLLGEIEFSSLGWKHMFRMTRPQSFKSQSLYIIPYLKQLLRQLPTDHWINRIDTYNRKDFKFYQYEFVLSFDKLKSNNSTGNCKVIVKVIEEIGYPINWKNEPLLSQKVLRRVVFKSCSLKK